MTEKRLGDMLIEQRLLSKEQVEKAVASQGGSDRLGEILADNTTVAKSDLGASLEAINGMPYIECPPAEIDPEVLARIPASLAARSCALPVAIKDKVLIVAMREPQNLGVLEELELAANMKIQPHFSFRSDVVEGIRRFYGRETELKHLQWMVVPGPDLGRLGWSARIAIAAGFCVAVVGGWQAAAIARGALGASSSSTTSFSSPISLDTVQASATVTIGAPSVASSVSDAPPVVSRGSDATPLAESVPASPEPLAPRVVMTPVGPVEDEQLNSGVEIEKSAATSPTAPVAPAFGSEVEVGAFRNADNAQTLTGTLRNTHDRVNMTVTASGLYVVSLGPFPEKAVADRAAREIQAETGLSPLVRRTRLD